LQQFQYFAMIFNWSD